MEIERKFLLNEMPDVEILREEYITQWYLTKRDDTVSNRLRLYGDGRCFFEFKQSIESIKRNEFSFPANFKDFEKLIEGKPFVEKRRFYIEESEEFIITIDSYEGRLKPLIVMEVEGGKGSDSFNDVFNWKVPKEWTWVEKEITSDFKYSNINLAEENITFPKDEEKIKLIINDCIAEEHRNELFEFIDLINDKEFSTIDYYYEKQDYNIVCMEFDYIKSKLLKQNKIIKKEGDVFGTLVDFLKK